MKQLGGYIWIIFVCTLLLLQVCDVVAAHQHHFMNFMPLSVPLSLPTKCFPKTTQTELWSAENALKLRGGSESLSTSTPSPSTASSVFASPRPRGGGTKGRVSPQSTRQKSTMSQNKRRVPSIYWAVLHNWFYFLSLGFDLINLPFMIREIIDGPNYKELGPSPKSIALSGKVESVDKLLTFCGIGFLSSLSDIYGRKPVMAWSALGFAITNYLQAIAIELGRVPNTHHLAIPLVYAAKFVDGCSSCMLPLCQAYVSDCTIHENELAANLGLFTGLSSAGAFILAFPIGGIVGAKYGPRVAILIAALLQLVNFLIIAFLTPESYFDTPSEIEKSLRLINWKESNPLGCLYRLFGPDHPLLSLSATLYLFTSLARVSLDAQFPNYTNIRFGWSQAESGPVLVLVGAMLTVAPKYFVSKWGLLNSILSGLIIFAIGLVVAGLAATPVQFIAGIAVVSVGCVCSPAITAVIANCASAKERGAILGSLGSLNELTGSVGFTLYAHILATFTSDEAPFNCPGFHFVVGGILNLIAWSIALPGFLRIRKIYNEADHDKLFDANSVDNSLEVDM